MQDTRGVNVGVVVESTLLGLIPTPTPPAATLFVEQAAPFSGTFVETDGSWHADASWHYYRMTATLVVERQLDTPAYVGLLGTWSVLTDIRTWTRQRFEFHRGSSSSAMHAGEPYVRSSETVLRVRCAAQRKRKKKKK